MKLPVRVADGTGPSTQGAQPATVVVVICGGNAHEDVATTMRLLRLGIGNV